MAFRRSDFVRDDCLSVWGGHVEFEVFIGHRCMYVIGNCLCVFEIQEKKKMQI